MRANTGNSLMMVETGSSSTEAELQPMPFLHHMIFSINPSLSHCASPALKRPRRGPSESPGASCVRQGPTCRTADGGGGGGAGRLHLHLSSLGSGPGRDCSDDDDDDDDAQNGRGGADAGGAGTCGRK